MIDYQPGQFIWAKNFTKIPKMKMKTKYLTEPLEVVKDFGHAVLAKNYSGIIFKLHKDNIKCYNAESLELYNALPFKTKMRLGAKFSAQSLDQYFNEAFKAKTEPADPAVSLTQLPLIPEITITRKTQTM